MRKCVKLLMCVPMLMIMLANLVFNSNAAGANIVYGKYTAIYTEAELKAIGENTSGNYMLMNDIALSQEWHPIDGFTGVFDGNGFTIKHINNSSCDNFGGLFSVNEGVIKNLNIKDSSFVFDGSKGTYFHCGAICGRNYGVVENCTAQNIRISYSAYDFQGSAEALVGGLVGWNESGTIRYCFSANINASLDMRTTGSGSNYYMNDIGGVVGFARGGTINDCITVNSILSANTAISYYDYIRCGAGGICGQGKSGMRIDNCYALYNTCISTNSIGDILGSNTNNECALHNNQIVFEGTLPDAFSSNIWGVRGIYNYPIIILPQNYSCVNGHTVDHIWVVSEEVTCTTNGEKVQNCTVCQRVAKSEVVKTNGHNYDEYTIIRGNKLIPPIVKERECKACGHIEKITDWSNIWITILAAIALVGVAIGVINYVLGIKKAQSKKQKI